MKSKLLKKTVPARKISLSRVLSKNKKIKKTVKQAASELTSVNKVLKLGKKVNTPVPAVQEAITQNVAVEHKVEKAANDLKQVNIELTKEVDERVAFESELSSTKIDLAEARDDLSKSQAKEEKTRQIMLHDALTGLPNRVLFEQRLERGLIQAKRRGWELAILFIDIDKFKSINDSYGHDLGDKVLLMVAHRLQSSVREEDTVCRWGGDEFGCLLVDVKQEANATRVAEKIVNRITEACEINGTVLSIKPSMGVAIYPADGETADILFKNADMAMYKAKGTGKRVVLFRETAIN
jgi:diguanylate cyclase (GGDEF)-like protein